MATAIKHPVPDRVKQSFVMFDMRALWRQSVWMSKITNDGLTRSGTEMLYSCSHMTTVGDGVKGSIRLY